MAKRKATAGKRAKPKPASKPAKPRHVVKMNRPTLSTMPNEILSMIVKEAHDNGLRGRQSVRNLCLTSKRIYPVARRELYRRIVIVSGHQLASLTRNLIENPSAREFVRVVVIHFDSFRFSRYSPDAYLFRDWANTAMVESNLSQLDRQLLVLCRATCSDKAVDNIQCVLGLLMFLLDKTQHLTLFADAYLGTMDRFLAAGLSLAASAHSNSLDYSALLPSLVSLDVCSKIWLQKSNQIVFNKAYHPFLAFTSSAHVREFHLIGTEGGLNNILDQIGSKFKLPFTKVTLKASDCTSSSLCVLLRHCPQLQYLEVETLGDGDYQGIGESINEVLPKYCPHLQVLSIRFFGLKDKFLGPNTLDCLPKMTKLTELRIEMESFITHTRDLGELNLHEKLPEQLEKLFVDVSMLRVMSPTRISPRNPEVMEFVKSVKNIIQDLCQRRADHFPRLNTIVFGCKYSKPKQWSRVANNTLAGTGAKVRVCTGIDSKRMWGKSWKRMMNV
ncbi:hypothetical protein CORC01_03783 [Colletotrichum orchidophilum]|uniref:F-box domain-containing protein n=1 Tax=Colletotrichum orchidophilum TaxID=1209926 RepID=A0A1G4BHV7_9PEZI|nr:uncharacterized protein CORC01_03783 [Colletotrichum orchidophilum]OHF00955.1 hypothetical protein CORC01_03783 [Colletotrichum orchidophilum]